MWLFHCFPVLGLLHIYIPSSFVGHLDCSFCLVAAVSAFGLDSFIAVQRLLQTSMSSTCSSPSHSHPQGVALCLCCHTHTSCTVVVVIALRCASTAVVFPVLCVPLSCSFPWYLLFHPLNDNLVAWACARLVSNLFLVSFLH